MQLECIISPLLAWYRENARELPWRSNISPYRTWISEIMLQQTRVETVIPYYERFLARLPGVADLASVSDDTLMKLWEGLGYYSRARNLKKAAVLLMEKYQGVFPDSAEEIQALPGIGEYTAGAISSIAFGKPIPAVDGNVLRVICRLTGCRMDISDAGTKKMIRNRLLEIYPAENPGDFTQALMELGAVVCLPNSRPHCDLCPLRDMCVARADGCESELPVKSRSKKRKIEEKTVLLIGCGNLIALRKRAEKGLLAGLWEFPLLDGFVSDREVLDLLKASGIPATHIRSGVEASHIFTHLEWHMRSFYVGTDKTGGDFVWVSREELTTQIALPSAFRAFFRHLLKSG